MLCISSADPGDPQVEDLRMLIGRHDWTASRLGCRTGWPPALETVLDLMLASSFAMCVGWGAEQTLFYNDAYALFLGARHPAALGEPLKDVWAELWPDIAPMVASAMAGQTVSRDDLPLTMTRHGVPQETWWTFGYSPLRDDTGAVVGFLNIATETTARILNERPLIREREQLAANESKLRAFDADIETQIVQRGRERATIWTVTPELLSVIDLRTGLFDRVNPAWTQTLGWTATDMEGASFLDFVLLEDLADSESAFETLREGSMVLRYDNRYRTKTGTWRWLSWVAVPFEGKLYASARDTTAERQQTDSVAALEDTLRQAQKMEAVGQLTGGVAQDFNTLLTVIRESVDLLRRPGVSEDRRTRYIEAIGETADRAAKLTGQLLAFARRRSLRPETFDCGKRIVDIATMIRTLSSARIGVETRVPEASCHIIADKDQFDTAIVNMSINARDAMGDEGVLTIVVAPVSGMPAIRARAPVPGDFVAVTIADSGRGIAPEQLDRVFEPFFSTKGPGHGTGLGLSQVIGFARQSGGDIQVERGHEGGTVFTLYLPRVASDGGDTAEDGVPAQDGRHGFDLLQKPYSIERMARVFDTSLAARSPRGR